MFRIMEKQLEFVLMLSLKEMALRKVTILLLTDSDIVASISKFRIPGYHSPDSLREWRELIECKIKYKMLKLEVSELLQKQVIDIVKPIGLQMRRWKDCQEDHLSNKNEKIRLPDSAKLVWTSAGTIDYRKTAVELARCDALDVVQLYKLACVNCLEDDIPLLWEKLPEENKLFFCNKDNYRNPFLSCLLFCWPHIIAGELSALDFLLRRPDGHFSSFNQWAFERSVEDGNRVAVEYFLNKLTDDEREASLMRSVKASLRKSFRILSKYLPCFRYEKLSDVSCYLLASLTPAQRMEILREHSSEVFLRFLDCPWPDLFLKNVELMWDFLPPSGYGDFLVNMAKRFALSDHYFPKVFRKFFVLSPPDCKKSFIDGSSTSETPAAQFLSTFFKLEDSESVKFIFRSIDAAERMRLVLSEDVLRVFYFYMLGGWHMMEVCLWEATLSLADRERLKWAFIKCHMQGGVEWENQQFKRFFDFLGQEEPDSYDQTDQAFHKRCSARRREKDSCCKFVKQIFAVPR